MTGTSEAGRPSGPVADQAGSAAARAGPAARTASADLATPVTGPGDSAAAPDALWAPGLDLLRPVTSLFMVLAGRLAPAARHSR